MEPRISIITLGVADLERSLRFYRDGLGFPTTRTAESGIIFFQTQGVCLALYPYDLLANDVSDAFLVAKSKFTGITLAHNVRTKEEVPQILAQAERAGGKIEKPAARPSGAATADIFPIPMDICGRSPTGPSRFGPMGV